MSLKSLRFNLRASIFQDSIPQDPPSISMLCMLIVLYTATHTMIYYIKYYTLQLHALDQGTYIFSYPLVCQMCVCFQENHTALPPVTNYTLFRYSLSQNPERNPTNHAPLCPIMLHQFIKLLLPVPEDKPVSLTIYTFQSYREHWTLMWPAD